MEELAAEHGIPVIHSHQLDRTVSEVFERVVGAVLEEDRA
jgi:2-phosphoglycerate kinase